VEGDRVVGALMDSMLTARAALWTEYCQLHDLVVRFVASNELCRVRFIRRALRGARP